MYNPKQIIDTFICKSFSKPTNHPIHFKSIGILALESFSRKLTFLKVFLIPTVDRYAITCLHVAQFTCMFCGISRNKTGLF